MRWYSVLCIGDKILLSEHLQIAISLISTDAVTSLNEEASWELKENLGKAQDTISDFHKNNPAAPRRVHVMPTTKKYENYTKPDVLQSLFGWEDGKFKCNYLDQMERAWEKWKGRRRSIQEWETEDDDNEFTRT